jgi:hypothetical protein
MKSQQLFCSACDRPVRVLITEEPTSEGQAEVSDTELVCLEIGSQCTGHLCPIGAVDPGAMVRRIVRDGIPLDTLQTVQADCPSCFTRTEMILYGSGKATCSACGATGRFVFDHLEPD